MVSANELRIGNWLWYDNDMYSDRANKIHNNWFKVKYIGETIGLDIGFEATQRFEKNPIWSPKINKLKPIPLTPEILEKCGFERLPNFNIMNSMVKYLPRKRHLSFGCIGTPNEMLFIQEMEDDKHSKSLIVLHNYDYDGYMHLHQLQNLYFALCGEELKINI